jgi:hypothetical protein
MPASYQAEEPDYDESELDDVAAAVGGDELSVDPMLIDTRAMPVRELGGTSAQVSNIYLVHLTQLAVELESCATTGADAGAIRLLRQRLTQWIEDLRSIGGFDELARTVEGLTMRLSAALAAPATLLAEAAAIADELAALATGARTRTPPNKRSRRAFWK